MPPNSMAFFMRDKDTYQPEIKEIDETDKDHTTNMLSSQWFDTRLKTSISKWVAGRSSCSVHRKSSVADPDPRQFGNPDQNPHQDQKPDIDRWSQIRITLIRKSDPDLYPM